MYDGSVNPKFIYMLTTNIVIIVVPNVKIGVICSEKIFLYFEYEKIIRIPAKNNMSATYISAIFDTIKETNSIIP